MNSQDEDIDKEYKEITIEEDLDQLAIFNALHTTISAIDNKKRLKILFTIADEIRKDEYADLYASKITRNVKRDEVKISEVAVGNFLKELVAADLLKKEEIKISRKCYRTIYKINPIGINRIFLELENLKQDLMDLTHDFEQEDFNGENQCRITVIDGVDAGESFLLDSDDGEVRIGRFGPVSEDDPDYKKDIKLSNEYGAVTKVSKPHALLKSENGKWFIYEGNSTNGTFINNFVLDVSHRHLNNKDVIKLARGDKGVSLLCSLN